MLVCGRNRPPLHQAAWFGQPDNARLLIEAGAPLDVFDSVHESSPLGWAAHGLGEQIGDMLRETRAADATALRSKLKEVYADERISASLDAASNDAVVEIANRSSAKTYQFGVSWGIPVEPKVATTAMRGGIRKCCRREDCSADSLVIEVSFCFTLDAAYVGGPGPSAFTPR